MDDGQPPSAAEVIVVGAGVIGSAVARSLADEGLGVTLVDPGREEDRASWAAAGMLSPLGEADTPGPFLRLTMESAGLYPSWIAELIDETGIDPCYHGTGRLAVAFSPDQEAELRDRFRWQSSWSDGVRWLDADELAHAEPGLAGEARAGVELPEDHQVDNRLLNQALLESLRRRGVELREGHEVTAIVSTGGRTSGVVLDDDRILAAASVVVAAGCWSNELAGLPRRLPVRPVRGQMVGLGPEVPRAPNHIVAAPGCYLVPRPDGRVLIGATVEDVGFRPVATPEGVGALLRAATRAVPGLKDAPIQAVWAGLRPGTPDGLPILGPEPELAGLFYATGHYRNGILLAPATAKLIARSILGEATSMDGYEGAFAVDRFDLP